jgi:hypothetical protein
VAACLRAGIPVRISRRNGWDKLYYGASDEPIGSARFIVAVLGALRPMKVRLNLDVDDTEIIILSDERGGYSEFHGDTLTAACMAAIVAAYPEQETTT